jgi:3-deoxy-D-manno-octulosonate 8-phosphate phosphatase (KDO 8-P phosphatase)
MNIHAGKCKNAHFIQQQVLLYRLTRSLEIRFIHLRSSMPTSSFLDSVSPDVLTRARRIKLFLMDVDGTLTDGGICLLSSLAAEGDAQPVISEMKVFNAQDGQGLSLANTMGIQTGFITGRRSPAVARRAQEMKVTYVCLGQATKMHAFEDCMRQAAVTEDEVAYLGDDLPDIPLARRSGLGVCVADGAPELKAASHYVTQRSGGRGAAREVIELILKAQGRWEEAVPLALA